ncbi:MAG: LLM class flavin-dependent oxidoreductase, partial [Chloroflexi bacterium]|nr:LLM class flavin-dependent oxidoreductase [Chloroflexota bacterium]
MDFWTSIGRIARNRLAPRSLAKGYSEIAESARRAEELGYNALTVPERHFQYNGATSYPLVPLAAVACHTRRIRLTTGSFLLPLHDPLRVAQDIAVLDNLTGGRLMLGFGPGYRPIEFAGFGPPKRTRGARLMEAVELLRRALSEDEFSWRGKFFRYERVRIRPRPLQRPHPPIWLAAGTSLYA